jgi:hypothetical protein
MPLDRTHEPFLIGPGDLVDEDDLVQIQCPEGSYASHEFSSDVAILIGFDALVEEILQILTAIAGFYRKIFIGYAGYS